MFDLLKGIRVVDLSTVALGPYATQLLADMGADVVKVEPNGGDIFRAARPGHQGGDGAGFLNLNRNKRSIALDLASDDDRQTLYELARTADVFVHNLRDRNARKLGVDYSSITRHKPDIVYCSARGYAQGPCGHEPAYDDCIQAASGLAWLNADDNGEPRYVRTILCDKVAGLHLAFAAAAGIAARERTGKGCHIETPMFEAMVSFLLIEQMSGQTFVPPLPDRGYVRLNAPSRKPYRTRDGYLAIMPYTVLHWRKFLRRIDRSDLADADWLDDGESLSNRVEELYALLATVAPERTTEEWLVLLRELDIPCAPVNRLDDMPADPHLAATEFFGTMTHPVEGDLMYARSPFRVNGPQRPDRPAPALDANRADILAELDKD